VNLDAVCITLSKSKESSKLLKSDLIPHSLGHRMKFSYVPSLFNIQSGKELSDDLIVPILLLRHGIPQVFGSTSSHYLIKDHVMLFFHVGLVNPFRKCHGLDLGNDDRLIAVLLKSCVKFIVNAGFLLNKPCIFLSLFLH
jgi:hypothetical protein